MILNKKIAVVGLWHLGEIVSVSLAKLGHEIIAIDTNKKVISNLKRGIPPIEEPGLRKLLKQKKKKISFTTDFSKVNDCDYIFLTYDTPVTEKDMPDTSILFRVVKAMAPNVKRSATLVVMSQVPVGTTKKLAKILGLDYVYFQENLQLGIALKCFLQPDRLVIGVNTDTAKLKFNSLIKKIKAEKIFMSVESAEMSKHALNAFLATSLSFTYNISDICEEVGADIRDVMASLRMDKRIGDRAYLDTSLGFSGGTLMRDLKTLTSMPNKDNKNFVINAVIKTNEDRRKSITQKLENMLNMPLSKANLGLLGVTYKPGTSTLRRSLALELCSILNKKGSKIDIYDPGVDVNELKAISGKSSKRNVYDMAKGCHGIILVTAWPQFKSLDFKRLKKVMKSPYLFFDTRNFLSDKSQELLELGFKYKGIGY